MIHVFTDFATNTPIGACKALGVIILFAIIANSLSKPNRR